MMDYFSTSQHKPSNSVSLSSIFIDNNSAKTLIYHHGLLGCGADLQPDCKDNRIAKYANVYCLDSRNHGRSPHTETNSIEDLAEDLERFIVEKKLEKHGRITLMGHSMGAMAIMRFMERYPSRQDIVERSILMDINCLPDRVDTALPKTLKMLEQIDKIDLKKETQSVQKQIDRISLSPLIASILKQNLLIINTDEHQWKCNLPVLIKQFHHIANFQVQKNSWEKPIEVIYGSKSKHIDAQQIQNYCQYFPQMHKQSNFYRIQAGHWVHFENRTAFLDTLQIIFKKDQK